MRPKTTYTVYRPDYFSDLVLVWTQPIASRDSAARRGHVLLAYIQELFQIECVCHGPDTQHCDPWSDGLPVPTDYCYFLLHPRDESLTAFLFLDRNSFEVHVPECWFFSGDTERDTSRFRQLIAWARKMDDVAVATFSGVEIDGTYQEVHRGIDSVDWQKYRAETYSRIEADEEGV